MAAEQYWTPQELELARLIDQFNLHPDWIVLDGSTVYFTNAALESADAKKLADFVAAVEESNEDVLMDEASNRQLADRLRLEFLAAHHVAAERKGGRPPPQAPLPRIAVGPRQPNTTGRRQTLATQQQRQAAFQRNHARRSRAWQLRSAGIHPNDRYPVRRLVVPAPRRKPDHGGGDNDDGFETEPDEEFA